MNFEKHKKAKLRFQKQRWDQSQTKVKPKPDQSQTKARPKPDQSRTKVCTRLYTLVHHCTSVCGVQACTSVYRLWSGFGLALVWLCSIFAFGNSTLLFCAFQNSTLLLVPELLNQTCRQWARLKERRRGEHQAPAGRPRLNRSGFKLNRSGFSLNPSEPRPT